MNKSDFLTDSILKDLESKATAIRGKSFLKFYAFNNHDYGPQDQFRRWDHSIECGRDYLCGNDYPMDRFLAEQTTSIQSYMIPVVLFCWDNPLVLIQFMTLGHREYAIYRRGEYIVISLPYHDCGGEKDWITRDFKTKVLINVD